jgi:hypothetical protein
MDQDKISDFFPWDHESNLSNKFMLCVDCESSTGEFSITMLLTKILKQCQIKNEFNVDGVHIISANHGRGHYESILKKNGLDINRLEKSGILVIQYLLLEEDESSNNNITWEKLISWQKSGMPFNNNIESINKSKSKNYSLFIDDLDAFELISPDTQSCRHFLSLCHYNSCNKNKIQDNDIWQCNSLIAYSRQYDTFTDNANDEIQFLSDNCFDNDEPPLSEICKYKADIIISISPLSTGYSSEIHGILAVSMTSKLNRQILNFKALDSGVKCSLVGSRGIKV